MTEFESKICPSVVLVYCRYPSFWCGRARPVAPFACPSCWTMPRASLQPVLKRSSTGFDVGQHHTSIRVSIGDTQSDRVTVTDDTHVPCDLQTPSTAGPMLPKAVSDPHVVPIEPTRRPTAAPTRPDHLHADRPQHRPCSHRPCPRRARGSTRAAATAAGGRLPRPDATDDYSAAAHDGVEHFASSRAARGRR